MSFSKNTFHKLEDDSMTNYGYYGQKDVKILRDDDTELEIRVFQDGDMSLSTYDEDDGDMTTLVLDEDKSKELYEFLKKHYG